MSAAAAPFAGIRVYDATQGIAGPHCTMLLALQGADVIKVEPARGDWMRNVGPRHGDHSAYSLVYNRGKRSVVLDTATEAGRGAARAIAASCDVVVESFRPGTMERLGLGHAALAAGRPELLYCSISGYGQEGPYRDEAAMDSVIQASSGWLALDREPGATPRLTDLVVFDILTGLYAFGALSARIAGRARGGPGGLVDISMLQSALAFLAPRLVDHRLSKGSAPVVMSPPNGLFDCADGRFVVNVMRQEQFAAVCRAVGCDALAADARFATRELRIANGAALLALIGPAFRARTREELRTAFRREGAIGAPMNGLDEVFADAHVVATQAIPELDLPGLGRIPTVAVPGAPAPDTDAARARPPGLGEHTRAVLAECGVPGDEVAQLERAGAVRQKT